MPTDPADPRRLTRAVIRYFHRGPATQPNAGDRGDVRLFNARGDSLPWGDYPSPDAAAAKVARLSAEWGHPIAVEWVPPATGTPVSPVPPPRPTSGPQAAPDA